MPNAAFYRTEARRCRESAAVQADAEAAKHLHRLAAEYDMLACELEPEDQAPARRDRESGAAN